jgi:IgGFc binding protein
MKRSRMSRGVIASVIAFIVAPVSVSACTKHRGEFAPPAAFGSDASVDAPDCRLQCSLDGRSVIEACTGRVVKECPDDLACGNADCMEPCAAAAADHRSNGCEFYFQEPLFTNSLLPDCYAAFLVNTSITPVEVSLDVSGEPLDLSKSMFRTEPGSASLIQHEGPIAPGESVVLFVSDASPTMPRPPVLAASYVGCPNGVVAATLATNFKGGSRFGSSYHLKTSVPVSMATIYPFGGAPSFVPSATLLLPVATWAKEHVVVAGLEPAGWGGAASQIVASEDDTEVTIVPTKTLQNGVGFKGGRANHPLRYRLGRGQFLQLVQDEELVGSVVSSNKPTTMFAGHSCVDLPAGARACDTLGQQVPPFEQWGSEYVGVAYRPRTGNEHEPVPYRIVAARDGTQLEYDPAIPPGAPTTLNAGESALFNAGTGDAFIVRSQDSEHPFYVAAHMTGGAGDGKTAKSYGGAGDPEFVNVVATGQYLSSYDFYADPTYAETSLVVVRSKTLGEFKDVWLECAGNLEGWIPVGTGGNYEFTRVDLARKGGPGAKFGDKVCRNGLQRMRSDGPFTATLWGWDYHASYAYTGGIAQRKLVDTPLLRVH